MTFDGRARVLIADADPGVRQGLSNRLLHAEVLTDTVPDGKAALEKLVEGPYAVVVLDLALPTAGAQRIVDMIGLMPRETRPVVLVVAPSGAARSLDVDVVQIVLRKPCDLAQLSAIVQSCVRSSAASTRETVAAASGDEQPAA